MREVYKKYKNASNEKILYEFQKQSLKQAKPNYLFALDTGTGKTITAIHHYMKYSNGEPLLVVAPPSKVKTGDWEEEVKFIEKTYDVSIRIKTISSGVLAKRWEEFKGWFVVFDEAHQFKNPTSQRGKAALKLSKAATQFVLLTATPMANGWEDSYNYFIMFNHFKNKTQINREFAVFQSIQMGPRVVPKIVGWRNEHVLEQTYQSFTVSISKDEALDLPPLVFKRTTFNKSKDYKTLEKDRVLNEEAYDTLPKLLHGLRYHANQKDKQEYVKTLLEGTTNNVIIFYNYKQEFEDLKEIVQKTNKHVYAVNGQMNSLPKKKNWDALKNSVTLIQYQAGSSGIELQYGNEVIFYTPTYSYQDYTQALGRAYRNGQTKKVTVYQFETKGTIETAVWTALKNKKDFDGKLYGLTKLGVE